MVRCLLAVLLLIATGGPLHAENDASYDQFARTIYAGMEESVRREYDAAALTIPRGAVDAPSPTANKVRTALKVLYYNKAALFAFCAADAERARGLGTARVPAENNIVLTSCVETKFAELNDFTNKLNYAGVFFPERIVRCGEASRLPDHERLLPPYGFLELAQPRLYDFPRYSHCLMTSD
jgi:hypothetical protein